MSKCICPECKSNNVVPIIYRYPAIKTIEEAEKGNLKLGGCLVYNIDGCGMSDRYCKDCKYEWCVDNFLVEDILKVRFRYWSNWGVLDPDSLQEDQWGFDILPEGIIKYFAYPRESRRILDKDVVKIESIGWLSFIKK